MSTLTLPSLQRQRAALDSQIQEAETAKTLSFTKRLLTILSSGEWTLQVGTVHAGFIAGRIHHPRHFYRWACQQAGAPGSAHGALTFYQRGAKRTRRRFVTSASGDGLQDSSPFVYVYLPCPKRLKEASAQLYSLEAAREWLASRYDIAVGLDTHMVASLRASSFEGQVSRQILEGFSL